MPILSFYEGYSELSFVVFGSDIDPNDYNVYRFPYTYSNNLFANSFTRDDFYKDVFQLACKSLKIKQKDYQLYSLGFLSCPELPFETVKEACVFSEIPSGYMYISTQMIAMKNATYSFNLPTLDTADYNFRANLDLYHNIIYYDSRDIALKDAYIREISHYANVTVPYDEIIITGDRLREFKNNPALGYLLILDVIRNHGTYNVKVDKENIFPHSVLTGIDKIDYPTLGTLVNIPGEVECLIETDVGTPQMFDLPADSIFVVPLDIGSDARVLVKSHETVIDKRVNGGELGIVIDTRDKMDKTEFKEVYLNYIAQSINRL